MTLAAADRSRLVEVLGRARAQGLVGPGELEVQLDHAEGFVAAAGRPGTPLLDLGSGAGLPGLVFAISWPASAVVLLDARTRAAGFLRWALDELRLTERCSVVEERAEIAAHDPDQRERFELVTARAFGPPAVTAECAAGFVAVGGYLIVSEPPEEPTGQRWPAEAVRALGFAPPVSRREGVAGVVVLEKVEPTVDRYPRRTGVPKKRPLWGG